MTDVCFLTILDARSPRSKCQQVSFFVRHLCQSCRMPPSPCVLTRPFLCFYTLMFLFLLRTTVLLDQGPTLVTSLKLNYFCKGSVSKCSHIGCESFNIHIWGTPVYYNCKNLKKGELGQDCPGT